MRENMILHLSIAPGVKDESLLPTAQGIRRHDYSAMRHGEAQGTVSRDCQQGTTVPHETGMSGWGAWSARPAGFSIHQSGQGATGRGWWVGRANTGLLARPVLAQAIARCGGHETFCVSRSEEHHMG